MQGMRIRFSDPGRWVLTWERYSKYHLISFLDNLQVLLFVFLIFCVRRSIDALDPDPGLYDLQRTSDNKSLKTKKNACKII